MTESQIQSAVIAWFKVACKGLHVTDERLLYHIRNQGSTGSRRGHIHGAIYKGMGLRAGVPDLFLAVARCKQTVAYYGLFIEMKTDGGRLSDAQREMHPLLRSEGYMVVVAKSFDEAVNFIVDYLGGARMSREGV